jgi:hypothetical protein
MAADKKSLTVACAAASSPTPKPSATKTRTPTNVAPTATAPAPTATRTRRPTRTATIVPPTPTASPTAHVHATNTPVAGATQTPVANQLCPESVHDGHNWHAPVHSSGCYYGHEHGDAPPQWVVSSRWPPMFTHPGNTPNENVLKHSSFKGFTLSDDGVSLYVIMHLDTNPNGHSSRFHSYQVWARDASAGISYWDLWADFGEGNNTGPNLRYDEACGGDTSVRPIMAVNFANCPLSFESWYSRAGAPGWGWDLGFNVKPQYYSGASPSQPSDPDLSMIHTWLPTGEMNDTRRIELAWYAFRQHPTGTFYSTQFGQIVSGPTDPVCGTTRTYGSKSYTVLCLEQYIAPTMTTFDFPGNSIQKDYDFTGVRLPN